MTINSIVGRIHIRKGKAQRYLAKNGFSGDAHNHRNHGFLLFPAFPCLHTLNICRKLWQKRIQFHMICISYLACKELT